jgi:hypothetical protein
MIVMEEIKRFMKRIRINFNLFVKGIINLYYWFPIIWKDRDWDHYFLEEILHYKLTNMYNFFVSKEAVTNWEVADQDKALQALKICVTILERRREEFYMQLAHDLSSLKETEKIYACEERDMRVLGNLLGKYLGYWWD